MDGTSLSLAAGLASTRLRDLRQTVDELPATASQSFIQILKAMLSFVADEIAAEIESYDADKADGIDYSSIRIGSLATLHQNLDVIHALLAEFGGDQTSEMPVGLMHLILSTMHDLIELPLGTMVDPIVHLDAENNYSVLDLIEAVATFEQIESEPVRRPLVMNLPYGDPVNAMYAPILAHEVAHIFLAPTILDIVGETLDDGWLDRRRLELLGEPRASDADYEAHLNSRLYAWLEEEICDAISCVLSGPSFIFAATAFLASRVRTEEEVGDHPPHQDRVHNGLHFLERLGWLPWIDARNPLLLTELRTLSQRSHELEGISGEEDYLRDAVRHHLDRIIDETQAVATRLLTVEDYEERDRHHELVAALSVGLMPPNLGSDPPTLWHVLLAAWEVWLAAGSDITLLSDAVSDVQFNRFLTKALELVGIAQLWSQDAPASS